MNKNKKKRMLITGVSGLLGNNLALCLRDSYDILGIYNTHKVKIDGIQTQKADIISNQEVSSLIKEFVPEIIIHCAAQADVDICEEDHHAAESINVTGTHNLVKNSNGRDIKFISISTDLVYDGKKGDFSESDTTNPLNWYGKTKYKSEKEVLKNKNALILRTNFWGWNVENKHSLGEWVINELSQKKEIQGFTDCIFSGMYTFELAKILDLAIKKNLSGIYNCASSTSLSKHDFIAEIASRLGLDKSLINPSSIDDYHFRAKRAKNLSLNVDKLARDLSVDIPSVSSSIERFVEDFKSGLPGVIKANGASKNVYPVSGDVIPYGRQSMDDDDIAAVIETLKSVSVTQGPKITEFETDLCGTTDSAFAVAVNSGTSALHIACLAAGIGPGDEVITSPNTFVASANCAVYCGGKPIFVDIDSRTYNLSPQELEKKISERTKAIIPVHFAGQSCDMDAIERIVRKSEKKYGHKIYIIEDACHALGSQYKETKVGSCTYSDMAVLSFHPVKHVTTGEGGAVLTNDKELRRKLSYFRSHGITSTSDEFLYKENAFTNLEEEPSRSVENPWYYEQNCLGYNYRITDIQCALGISQLKKINGFQKRRQKIVDQYNTAFKGVEWLITPFEEEFCNSNFHLYVLGFDFKKIRISRAQVISELKKKGILTQVHYIPVHTQPFYQKNFNTRWGNCPVAEQYYRECLSIPLHPAMTDDNVRRVIFEIRRIGTINIEKGENQVEKGVV